MLITTVAAVPSGCWVRPVGSDMNRAEKRSNFSVNIGIMSSLLGRMLCNNPYRF